MFLKMVVYALGLGFLGLVFAGPWAAIALFFMGSWLGAELE